MVKVKIAEAVVSVLFGTEVLVVSSSVCFRLQSKQDGGTGGVKSVFLDKDDGD